MSDTKLQQPTDRKEDTAKAARTSGWVRDHLANERTFLAWIRTGIAMMGFGFLVAKLKLEVIDATAKTVDGATTLGALFALAGIVTVSLATWRYLTVRDMIDNSAFRPLGHRLILFTLLIIGIGVAIILNLAGGIRLSF